MKLLATYYIMKHFGEQYQPTKVAPGISLLKISSLFSQGYFAQS